MQAKRKTGLTLFVQAGQDASKFLCAQPARDANQSRLSVLAYGETEASDGFSGIVSLLGEKKLKPRNLVLLLPRSAFEVNLFQLPDVEADDVPLMVSNLVAESMESLEFTTDYILNAREPEGKNALTWTLENQTIQEFKDEAKNCGMNLASVTSHAIGSISLWRNLVRTKPPHAVIVTIANQSIDFSVIYNQEVTHIRSVPFRQDDIQQITNRLISELQRTVAVVGDSEESESTRLYLFGSSDDRKTIAEALTEEFEVPVFILNPVDNTDFVNESMSVSQSEQFAHLLGAAKAFFHDKIDVDLISPRRAEKKTFPWRRVAVWVLIALSVLGGGGYVLWDEAAKENEAISEKRTEFDKLAIDARRVLEMKDELAAIRAWRRNEVVWLDQLDDLSRKLPTREQSLIRRISMTASDDGSSQISLSVEVTDNSLVAGLEDMIRTSDNRVTSKRVAESSDKTGEKWDFETSISFVAKPPKLSFVEEPKKEDSEVPGEPKGSSGTKESQTDIKKGDSKTTESEAKASTKEVEEAKEAGQ